MQTVLELREHADAKLFAGEYPAALHAYAVLVQLQPNDLDARLRLADTLLAMGEVQAAAFVYTQLARHAANAGYPLRALVMLKILEALEPELGKLLASFAKLYAKGSERLEWAFLGLQKKLPGKYKFPWRLQHSTSQKRTK